MSTIVRARLFSTIFKKNNNRWFSVTANPPKEPIVSSSSILNNQAPRPPTDSPPPSLTDGAEKKPWNFLKYGLIAALTGGLATAGYATYAYSLDEIDEKTKAFRASANYTSQDDASASDDFSMLNRDPSRILYVSGNALETSLQPENCVPIKQWKGEAEDTALLDLIPFLEYVARHRPADIRPVLASYQGLDIAKEFIERSKEHQKSESISLYLMLMTFGCYL